MWFGAQLQTLVEQKSRFIADCFLNTKTIKTFDIFSNIEFNNGCNIASLAYLTILFAVDGSENEKKKT